jgi:hypothetical protein
MRRMSWSCWSSLIYAQILLGLFAALGIQEPHHVAKTDPSRMPFNIEMKTQDPAVLSVQ